MIDVITDLAQSAAIIMWSILFIVWARRVRKLEARPPQQLTYHFPDGGSTTYSNQPSDPEPICGCKHHQCFHDENGCAKVENWSHFGSDDKYIQPCGCKRYTGPEQLPTVIP